MSGPRSATRAFLEKRGSGKAGDASRSRAAATHRRSPPSSDPPWPADTIERRKVADLVPYARNARKHDLAQVTMIADLIRKNGWTVPVLIDEAGRIIAGHGRVLAAQQLGLAEIPVAVARGWSEAQKRAYALADNQVALLATWNKELLRVELTDLQVEGIDLETLGFAAQDAVDPNAPEGGGELPRAIQLEPTREYAVILCRDDAEWSRLKVALGLTPVRRGGYKKGSQFDDVGTQRVVYAADVLALLEGKAEAA